MLQTMESRGDLPTLQRAPTEDLAPTEPRGTDPSFEAFFRANATRLYRAMYLVARDSADAQDLVQDAFVRVWERWDRVAAMADPVGYLYRAAMNGMRSRWRHRAWTKPGRLDNTPAMQTWILTCPECGEQFEKESEGSPGPLAVTVIALPEHNRQSQGTRCPGSLIPVEASVKE